jgi:ELWxxDGT repeat protein
MRRWIFLAVLAALLPDRTSGQSAYLVQDLAPFTSLSGSAPQDFLTLGSRVVFLAETGSSRALWATDGTAEGTRFLADLCEERCQSATLVGSAKGRVFLTAQDFDSHEPVLWSSDGTRSGTFPLAEVQSDEVVLAGGKAFFRGEDDQQRLGLWTSDGTPQGTGPVGAPDYDSYPSDLTAAGNRVFFVLNSFEEGLWVSDGTAAGTSRVLDNVPGLLSAVGSRVYFILDDDENGSELWVSDGTPAGSLRVSQFETDGPFGPTRWIKPLGSRAYFLADDRTHGVELWSSDGTLQGTRRATEISYQGPFPGGQDQIETAGARLVFVATDGLHGYRVWTAGATPETTAPLEQGCPGGCPTVEFSTSLLRVGDHMLFLGRNETYGQELWSTDGTAAGTLPVKDLCSGVCDAVNLQGPWPLLGGAVFSQGGSLWQTDGTPAGTRRITAARPGFSPGPPAALGKRLVFAADDEVHGRELWVNDGTLAGTRMLADLLRGAAGSFPSEITPFGGGAVFRTNIAGCPKLFRTQGLPEDVVQLASNSGCFALAGPARMTVLGNEVFYWRRPVTGPENPPFQVWATDGSPGSPDDRQVSSFPAPSYGDLLVPFHGNLYTVLQRPEPFTGDTYEVWRTGPGGTAKVDLPEDVAGTRAIGTLGQRLYFVTRNPDGGSHLWVSDGGPNPVALPVPDGLAQVPLVRAGGWDYFRIYDGEESLWKTNGTPAGTSRVVGLRSYGATVPTGFVEHQGALYFFGVLSSGDLGTWGLWRSDGTEAGTRLVRPFAFPEQADPVPGPVSFNGRLYFAVDDGVHGRELWSSDGTPEGTVLVRDLDPGAAGSRTGNLTVAGGRLFFTALDPVHGDELWQTDGTQAGTRLVQDIAPLAESSHPDHLTASGDKLFFVADDRLTGRELWVLPLGARGCQASATVLCLGQGRYKVEVAWRDFQGHTGAGRAASLTADTGSFWFFDPANVEVVVKVLDGQAVNGHQWVFYGALSNVEYTLTVTDTQTGLTRRYFNPLGQFASVGDTTGFGPQGAYSTVRPARPSPAARSVAPVSAVCQPTATRLCLQGGRFAVEADWKDFAGKTGKGQAVSLTGDTGYLWFFNASNIELVVKVLDGRPVNGHFWVFYGALSNVEYSLKVTDMETGEVRTYKNPAGRLASNGDTGAF